ncbi:MAG: protocatechuate 3,4-dioxygenase subunit beta, partial [Pseudomonadota bacterium]
MAKAPPEGPFLPRDRAWQPPALTPAYKSTRSRAPNQPLLSLPQSLSETTGPVFSREMIGPLDHDLLVNAARPGESAIGPRILVYGRVLEETGRGVPDTLIEIWQANAGGRYRHRREGYIAPLDPNFGGCGRVMTDREGRYEFLTVQPGPYPWPNGPNSWRPAHIHVSLFGEAFAQRLITQMYFEGDPLIWRCPIVTAVPEKAGVERLIAGFDPDRTLPMDARAYRFDIVLRGRRQTL